jgi:hypothetical protein
LFADAQDDVDLVAGKARVEQGAHGLAGEHAGLADGGLRLAGGLLRLADSLLEVIGEVGLDAELEVVRRDAEDEGDGLPRTSRNMMQPISGSLRPSSCPLR